MSTAADIIRLALLDIGVIDSNEAISAQDMIDSMSTLNAMLASWDSISGYDIGEVKIVYTATGATPNPITIGPSGATITASNPVRISNINIRISNVDNQVLPFLNFDEYLLLSSKAQTGIPYRYFHNHKHPSSELYLYPAPISGELHIWMPVKFPVYDVSADDIYIPACYEMVVRFSLAEMLAPMFGAQVSPQISTTANNLRRILAQNNAQIPQLYPSYPQSRIARFLNGGD